MALRLHATSSTSSPSPRVIPAQVNFLTIYNPTLGDTDETEKDQIVFWAGKDEIGTNRTGRKESKESTEPAKALDEEQAFNEKLRQIGLARGMVQFARNFANDHPLDTIETDRARIVLYELEKDWWILASIDLTRLPPTQSQTKSNDDTSSKETQSQYDYSNREVSPATLLRTQLIKAHRLFLLHHAVGLWELYNKLGRVHFCALLNRYWEKFARNWDVLLHGNPAVDVYGDCIKLSGGGELGVGVGEEEWGSGEREVLEGFVERTDGCVECVVGRYGATPVEKPKKRLNGDKKRRLSLEEKIKLAQETEKAPWLGTGEDPGPADGVVFSGVGTLERKSLATVSQWMEAIFKHGNTAYGVGENPASKPRQKRRRPRIERQNSDDSTKKDGDKSSGEVHPRFKSPKTKAPDLRRRAMENSATPNTPPGIPAPLVGAVERSLDAALAKAEQRSSSKSPSSSQKSSPTQEKSQEEAMKVSAESKDDSSSVFSMEGMKNVLSLGYGSSWTLNPNGFEKKGEKAKKSKQQVRPKTPPSHKNVSDQTSLSTQRSVSAGSKPAEERLQEIDPTPEVSDEDLPFVQRLEQSIGKFLIGLSGDLENQEFEDSDGSMSANDRTEQSAPQRIFLRTLTVELAHTDYHRPSLAATDRTYSRTSHLSKTSVGSGGSVRSNKGPDPKTSASASIDGPQLKKRHEKLQVAVYVHQPFIFVFLFELHTANLTMPAFYRSIHHQLGPLQKPLLQRTDPTRVVERIATALNEKASAAVSAVKKQMDNNGNIIYDLVYDPAKNTIRTSIPNIPIPTSPESAIQTPSTVSGSWYTLGIPIGTSNSPSVARLDPVRSVSRTEPWTRVEALNVHTQILNTFIATRNPNELERTVKTARGWWVLWMRISSPGKESEVHKEAFLVRKSVDYTSAKQAKDGARNSGSGSQGGRWLLRDQSRDISGGSGFGSSGGTGGAVTGAKGVSEGVGVDARKWVEGLLSLTQ